jgi:hypothetical protein
MCYDINIKTWQLNFCYQCCSSMNRKAYDAINENYGVAFSFVLILANVMGCFIAELLLCNL